MAFNRHLFSAALRSHLSKHHLSVREAAKATGVSASTISRIVNNSAPDIDSFAALTAWMDTDVNLFLSQRPQGWTVEEQWAWLHHDLEVLGVPKELIEAMMVILRLVVEKKGGA